MMIEHHIFALMTATSTSLELLSTQPDTDTVVELKEITESMFDILSCIISSRHYGSDQLDEIIDTCKNISSQVKKLDEK